MRRPLRRITAIAVEAGSLLTATSPLPFAPPPATRSYPVIIAAISPPLRPRFVIPRSRRRRSRDNRSPITSRPFAGLDAISLLSQMNSFA